MNYKDHFDISEEITYLNTPGNGLMPCIHYSWRKQRENDLFDPRSDLRDKQPEFIQTIKEAAGQLFNCSTTNCYAIPNFSFDYNTLLEGLDAQTKFAIINTDHSSLDYPIISSKLHMLTNILLVINVIGLLFVLSACREEKFGALGTFWFLR